MDGERRRRRRAGSWAPLERKKKYVNLGCVIVSCKIFIWTIGALFVSGFLTGLISHHHIVKTVPLHYHGHAAPNIYTIALHKALMFFNAQCCICGMSHLFRLHRFEKLHSREPGPAALMPLSR